MTNTVVKTLMETVEKLCAEISRLEKELAAEKYMSEYYRKEAEKK